MRILQRLALNLGGGSFTTSTQIDALFKIQIFLLQQAFSKSAVVYPENNALNRLSARQSLVLARDLNAIMYASIDSSLP